MDFITPFTEYILQCDSVKNNKLFINAVTKAQDGAKQLVTSQIDRAQDKEYVDGSVLHKVIFTVFDFKSISFNAIVKSMLKKNKNIESLLEVQALIDWIAEQQKKRNYPDFGNDYEVERIETTYLTPSTPAIDSTATPEIAKYSIPIVCYVMDYTEAIR